jgi:hypothetical protein
LRRTLLTILTVALLLAWVVLSYAPATWLPQLQWPAAFLPWLGGALVLGFAAFLAIQVWLVVATDRSLQTHPDAMREFRLKRGTEGVLTALPIAMTLLLVWATWPSIQTLF